MGARDEAGARRNERENTRKTGTTESRKFLKLSYLHIFNHEKLLPRLHVGHRQEKSTENPLRALLRRPFCPRPPFRNSVVETTPEQTQENPINIYWK